MRLTELWGVVPISSAVLM